MLDGQRLDYQLVRTVGRRAVHIVIDPVHGLEIRAPYHFSARAAGALLLSNRAWVLSETAAAAAQRPPALMSGTPLPYLGEQLELLLCHGRRDEARREGGVLRVAVPEPGEGTARACLERWYRRRAREHFGERLLVLAPRFGGLLPTRLSVRGQRTRWGSCSEKGAMSLNWRLLMLEAELVDYVVAHELCHLSQMNHSRAFWSLMQRGMPDYASRRSRLSQAGVHLPL